MSLADAVNEIAEQMDLEPECVADLGVRATLRGFARQLRSAVKAAERDPEEATPAGFNPFAVSPDLQNFQAVEAAKQEFRQAKAQLVAAENVGATGGLLALCVGGPVDNTYVDIAPEMPVGARTILGDGVYQFREDRQFHFDEGATRKEYEKRGLKYEGTPAAPAPSKLIIP